jgi:ferredoxin|tara:strand:- start:615 stop:2957 length:2343 start_codon:yes stop_codon:yes gene_type:complete
MSTTDEVAHYEEETPLIDLEGLHFPPDGQLPDGHTKHDVLREASRFHAGDPSVSSEVDADLLPAVMHTLRRPSLIRTDYPLVLLEDGKIQPLVDFFVEIIATIENSKVLSDNLVRVERQVREALKTVADAAKVIGSAGAKVGDMLSLNEKADHDFRTKGAELVQAIPAGTKLVPCDALAGPTVALHLIEANANHHQLRESAIKMRDALRGLNSKESTVEAAGINTNKLQEVLGKTASGSVPMDELRTARIDKAAQTIEHWLKTDDKPIYVVHSTSVKGFTSPSSATAVDGGGALCKQAMETFDSIAERHAALFGAMRTARLELANAYESHRHDHLLEHFCRRSFSDAECDLMPRVVAVGTVHDALGDMASLSTILRSSRPITLLLLGDDLATLDHERIELAYLAVAHRKCFASQTSISHPSHLVDSIKCGLESVRPTLHTIASEDTHPLGAWLEGNAAIEGRACPLLRYDPSKGATWAERFDLVDNPQPEHDWPIWTGEVDSKQLELSFTFAHCAMLTTDLQKYFKQLPDGIESEDLKPIEEWLHVSLDEASKYLPYLWAADQDGAIHKLIVAREVTDVCRERLDYWRTLRELAGIDNSYVKQAVEDERELMDSEFATEREVIENNHACEIETIRTTASQVAMQQLAEVLLGGGCGLVNPLASPSLAPTATVPSPATNGVPIEETVEEVVVEERQEEELGDPWIDSPLCTTCNDCMDVNAQVFVYNEDKQAYIKDATAGTYEEIVRAAEVCPARCIHPGGPLNPNEPNLDALIERASEFN